MDDTEKAIRAKLLEEPHVAGFNERTIDERPDSLVLAPFRLVAILDTERETIAALRREMDDLTGWREQCAANEGTIKRLTGERNRLRDELAARTEELRLARNYMDGLLGYIENDLERVDRALGLLGVSDPAALLDSDPAALLDKAQAFVCVP